MNHKQLFCYTYAGGSASFFDIIANDIFDIELVATEYAGHGERRKEPFYSDFGELADDMFKLFKDHYSGGEYSFFGYSMGSIVLVEVLKRVIDAGFPMPKNLFIAAHEPHKKAELSDYTGDRLDEWVKDRTVKFGAVPAKLLDNKAFWRVYLPLYRSDYKLISNYEFERLDLKVSVPTVVFYSEKDTPISEMLLWERYFPCEFFRFDGNHFFIQQHHEEMGRIIMDKMGVMK